VRASSNETPCFFSLEAAFLGCKVIVSPMGDTKDYFEDMVGYCAPNDVSAIRKAIDSAHKNVLDKRLKEKVIHTYNWTTTALKTAEVYAEIIKKK
jgi:glycosyltransferase involved in cell wall biosynthesis